MPVFISALTSEQRSFTDVSSFVNLALIEPFDREVSRDLHDPESS
jgi:hypothetical protein